jgi:rod shape-determining protein MreD
MRAQRFPSIRPRHSLWRRLDIAARMSVPAATTAGILLVLAAPFGFPGQPEVQRAMALCSVFFWSLFRPTSMPPAVVFVLGLFADLLGYAPPGVMVLVWLLVHGTALRWRRSLVRLGFVLVWFALISVACGAAVMEWALTSLLTFHLLPPSAAFFQAALAVGLYPVVAVVLTGVHQTFAEPDHA